MLISEQVESVDKKELKQQESQKRSYKSIERAEKASDFQLSMTIYQNFEKEKREEILKQVEDIEKEYQVLSDQTVGRMLDELLKVVEHADKHIMFGMPGKLVHGMSEEKEQEAIKETSLIGYLIKSVSLIKKQNLNLEENNEGRLNFLCSKISNLISTGTYVKKEILDSYCNDILVDSALEEKRNSYLLSLEKAVCDSIKNDKKEGIVVERDNKFYCVKCPEESVITPARFMNSPEFKDLEYGALRMGEGDNIIRLYKGKYCDMKGKLKMTFKVGNEKLEMTLSSIKDHTLSFGAITVHMDDKSCEIFSKYLKELEKEPRVSKVVEAAKSFVQSKTVSPPLSSMGDANVQQRQDNAKSSQSNCQSPN
ncbi:hypothetical protein [Wolbachia endosymbiont of Oedothorax gibbosus]|uniref:hypothetical protein n=1 Tax=Wolbachia endosymbiont of Oedothorax gibbosus TaxID=931100 RepID=UPI002025A69C|nr:hypothetical protein [Wolbachia endosymbiont of Oedothorax gibbosus]